MRLSGVSVATITLVRDKAEERALCRALPVLVETGLPVIVSDGGSPPAFIDFLRSLHVRIVSPKRRGLVAQVKAGLRSALSLPRPFILYTEPDKLPFFEHHLVKFLQKVRANANLGMVCAARDKRSFATFPEGQQWAESVINRATAVLLKKHGDYCYGPILLSRAAATLALDAPEHLGWGWRFWTLAKLSPGQLPISTVTLQLPCPDEQRRENSRADQLYRIQQLRQNLEGLLLGSG